ncbi:MAG TPA: hypothetical protein VH476_08220, partial [Solirubrobacterales bacterium]
SDSVTVSGGFETGGELIFQAFGPNDETCAGAVKYEGTVAVSGNGPYSPAGFAPPAGTYRWTVSYSGDADNETASLPCNSANQSSSVAKASPSLAGTATSAVVGATITDSVTVSGGFQPGGSLTFRAFGPNDATCAGAVKYEATVTVNGNGAYAPGGFSPAPGAYRWTVSYSGDANNEAASLPCNSANQTSTVAKASPGLAGTATSAVVVGATISDSVTVSGGFQPGGELTFQAFGPNDATCAGAVKYEATVAVSGNGAYSPAAFAPPAGTYRWTVSYGGDSNNEAASLLCNSANQSSTVAKASPGLAGTATSAVVGATITDSVTVSGGFETGGELTFRAFGPNDETCAGATQYEATVAVSGNGPYSPAGFTPPAGLYRWTVSYSGDSNNEAAGLACNAANQSSAVGTLTVTLTATGATDNTVGAPVTATASITKGAIPTGKVTFRAFPPVDEKCSGAPAFSSTVNAIGNGSYTSAAFTANGVGTFRWTVSYSGDANHAPAVTKCGAMTSHIAQARPAISSGVEGRGAVGRSFRITATISGGYAPTGTVTFQIFDQSKTVAGCAILLAINTVPVAGNSTVSSAPFVPRRPARYSFIASYSGDAANQAATQPCDPTGHAAQVLKRRPKVQPRARLIGRRRISVRAQLSGAASPSGMVSFRLYRPGDVRCKRHPVFSGAVSVKSNGRYLLGQFVASRRGIYRLSVSYSGDQRNRGYSGGCSGAQAIRVR